MRVLVLFLVLAGCGGTEDNLNNQNNVNVTDGGKGGLGDPCTTNDDCESDLCTKESYDRKPGPVCTYRCDPANPNPLCPNGCNMKGYCRIPS